MHPVQITSEIFAKCHKALLEFHNKGVLAKTNAKIIHDARIALIMIIADIATNCSQGKQSKHAPFIHTWLHDLHPRTDYRGNEKLIRDLADICTTLHSVENGVARTKDDKIGDAAMFCSFLKEIL